MTKVMWQNPDHSKADEQGSRLAETNSRGQVGRVRGGNKNNEIKRLASSQIFKIIPLLYFYIHFNVTANSGELPFLKTLCSHISHPEWSWPLLS